MAWTRDDSSSDGFIQAQNQTTNTQQNNTGSSSSVTNNNSVQNIDQTVTTNTQNMTGKSLAALELLIQQLLGGGTNQQARQMAKRQQEIQANQALRSDYTKEAAFADAQGAMNHLLQQAMESSLPALVRAAEGYYSGIPSSC
jgi:hypothetical protein